MLADRVMGGALGYRVRGRLISNAAIGSSASATSMASLCEGENEWENEFGV